MRRFSKTMFLLLITVVALCQATDSPKFNKIKIGLGKRKITVELADTPERSAYGLMYRKTLGENEGMLFVFQNEQPLSFWMKNTFVDLSIGFFSAEKKLLEVRNMSAALSEMQSHFETYESTRPAQYALEMRLGWFEKNNIKVGDKLEIVSKK